MQWIKGTRVLQPGEKYQMKQKVSVNELLISKGLPEDSGDYSCVCGDQKTTSNLKIKGRRVCILQVQVQYDMIHHYNTGNPNFGMTHWKMLLFYQFPLTQH